VDDKGREWLRSFGLHGPCVRGHRGLAAGSMGDGHVVVYVFGVLFGEVVSH